MRIVGGDLKGRKFTPPMHLPARPTTDIAKEGLFNTLQNRMDWEGASTLDLFAGVGNVSFELASRGASNLTLVERDRKSVNFIKQQAEVFGVADRFKVLPLNVFGYLETIRNETFDFIFADPPYDLGKTHQLPDLIFRQKILKEGGIFVLEHSIQNDFKNHPHFQRLKKYGETIFSFFE